MLRGDGRWLFDRDGGVATTAATAAPAALDAAGLDEARSRAAVDGESGRVTGGAGPPGGVFDGRRLKDKDRTPATIFYTSQSAPGRRCGRAAIVDTHTYSAIGFVATGNVARDAHNTEAAANPRARGVVFIKT